MATPSPTASTQPRRPWGLWLALVVVLGLLGWFWPVISGYARTGASFGARVGCACHQVEGRDLADCHKDFEPGMGWIVLSENAKKRSVTARFPLLASETATYMDGPGCVLQPWKE